MIQYIRSLQCLRPQRILSPISIRHLTTQSSSRSSKTTPSSGAEPINDEPIKFFGSRAATWRAKDTRSGGADEVLWYQPYVISGSLAVFMIYFCILREENDIDRKLDGSLFDHIEGLEEQQLVVCYKHNRERGLDTTDIEKRLLELGIDARKLDQ